MKNIIQKDGEYWEKCSLIMLPANGIKSYLSIINSYTEKMIGSEFNESYLSFSEKYQNTSATDDSNVPQHLYILSDEEIKKDWNEWAYKKDVKDKIFKHFYTINTWYNDAKKIIATTNPLLELTCNGKCAKDECVCLFPQIPQSFIQEFVKANGKEFEEVLVKVEKKSTIGITDGGRQRIFYDNDYSLVLLSSNKIIIKSNVDEKLYTTVDVKQLLYKAIRETNKINNRNVPMDATKWIEDNL